jgi:hypothetical protein
MQKVIICAGPGGSRTESAGEMKSKMPSVDVLDCPSSTDIKQKLRNYEGRTSIIVMLQYYFGQHPRGSRGAQDWHPTFMDAFEMEFKSRNIRTSPADIKTNVNADTGSIFLVCPWSSEVEPADVVSFVQAIEVSFARKGW